MITLPASDNYGHVRQALIEALGEDGAWLVLSIDHYGWRARYDLANSLVAGAAAESEHHQRHLQSLLDLEVQSDLYAAVEQLGRLLLAIRKHEAGTDLFFEAYVASGYSLPGLIEGMGEISGPELRELLDIPADVTDFKASLWKIGSAQDAQVSEGLFDQIQEIVDQLAVNLGEFQQMVEQLDLRSTDAPVDEGHSLRTVDNAFRHGLKVLFHDTLPADRTFGVAVKGEADPLSEFAVDLYQSSVERKFATIDGRPERTAEHLAVIAAVCVRIKQMNRGFIASITDQPGLLATWPAITVAELDASLQDT